MAAAESVARAAAAQAVRARLVKSRPAAAARAGPKAGAQAPLRAILAQRDVMITELSRASLESGGQLAELFAQYRAAMGDPVGPIPAPSAAPATPTTTTGL